MEIMQGSEWGLSIEDNRNNAGFIVGNNGVHGGNSAGFMVGNKVRRGIEGNNAGGRGIMLRIMVRGVMLKVGNNARRGRMHEGGMTRRAEVRRRTRRKNAQA